jgi:hypothetical protein
MVFGAAAAVATRPQRETAKERNEYADNQEEDAVLSKCTAWQSAGQFLTTSFNAIDSPRMVAVLGVGRESKGKIQYWDNKRIWLTFEGLHLDDTEPTFKSMTTCVRISGLIASRLLVYCLPTDTQKSGSTSCALALACVFAELGWVR